MWFTFLKEPEESLKITVQKTKANINYMSRYLITNTQDPKTWLFLIAWKRTFISVHSWIQ